MVTGANSGLGLVTAKELARAGAKVIMACRSVAKGEAAAKDLQGDISVRELDLGDLASVRNFAESLDGPVELLINNAGISAVPLQHTADGFEAQIGVNHLGHFALTGLLLDRITGRVVTLSSGSHRQGKIRFDDLNWENDYSRWKAYGQSKLANLLFAYELQRRLADAGSDVLSMAAHPGVSATNVQSHTDSPVLNVALALVNKVIAQSAEMGAEPTLYAATQPGLPGGSYVGPGGVAELRGHPRLVTSSPASHDVEAQRRLWDLSMELTGVSYDFAAAR